MEEGVKRGQRVEVIRQNEPQGSVTCVWYSFRGVYAKSCDRLQQQQQKHLLVYIEKLIGVEDYTWKERKGTESCVYSFNSIIKLK